MSIDYFVFNYNHFNEALSMFNSLSEENCNVYLINCVSETDPEFAETDRIKKFPNIYYSGQYNEALKLVSSDVMCIINSDVAIEDYKRFIKRINLFYSKFENAGLYAPNLHWTPWTYNPALLEEVYDSIKKVPATDSTIWSLKTTIAKKIGPIDLNVNRLGWGIEIIAAYECYLQNKLVVRDYGIKCSHPRSTAYNRGRAESEFHNMIKKLPYKKDFWNYYYSRDKYGFNWRGNYVYEPIKIKMR